MLEGRDFRRPNPVNYFPIPRGHAGHFFFNMLPIDQIKRELSGAASVISKEMKIPLADAKKQLEPKMRAAITHNLGEVAKADLIRHRKQLSPYTITAAEAAGFSILLQTNLKEGEEAKVVRELIDSRLFDINAVLNFTAHELPQQYWDDHPAPGCSFEQPKRR